MKNTKRILACFLAVLMTLSCFAVVSVGADAVSESVSVYDPNTTATLSDAVDGVVYIDSANELMAFKDALNGGNNFAGKTIKLTCDIVINQGDVSTWTNPVKWDANGSGWGTRFAGSFDGQGHTISGIYNDAPNNAGFFGRVVGLTEFKNVTITNSKFISWGGTDGKGLGGLIGSLDPNWGAGTTTISNVHIDAILEAPQGMGHVGGLVGGVANHNSASLVIENCSFNGTMGHSSSVYVGGLVGYMKGVDLSIENCSVDADITCANNGGGFVGRLESCNVRINNSVAQGTVNASSANGSGIYYTSSIIGCIDLWNKGMMAQMSNVLTAVCCSPKCETAIATIRGDANYRVRFDLENIVYDATVQTPDGLVRRDNGNAPTAQVNNSSGVHGTNWYLEGQLGSTEYFRTTGKATSELKGKKVFDFWTAVEIDYPTPPTTATPDFYNGTANDAYAINDDAVINIYTAEQFMGFAKAIVDGNSFSGKTIKLANDIIINTGDASDWGTNAPAYNWNAFSGTWGNRFAGNFDGQGHIISGIYNKHDTAAGLFGRVTGGNTVQNVSIVNSYFESTGASGDTGAGAIFGFADAYNLGAVTATIKNVHVEATVVGSSSSVHSTGGLVGRFHNYDSSSVVMENCSFNGTVTGVGNKVGGLIGGLSATNLSITNCSVNASITAQKTAGGLVGRALKVDNTTISDCLVVADINVTEADTTAGVIGYYATEYAAGNATISDTLVSVRGENVLAVSLGHWGKDGKMLTVTLDNVKYDSSRFNGNKAREIYTSSGNLLTQNGNLDAMTSAQLKGNAIFDGWTAVQGGYPVPAGSTADSLKAFAFESYGSATEILGYQTKDNGNGTYAVRLIATLTNKFDASYAAAGFKDVKVTLTNGAVKEIPVYYCAYSYNSVIGGGATYNAGDYLSDKIFCLSIDNAPAEVSSIEATPFVMIDEESEPVYGKAIAWEVGAYVTPADAITVMSFNVYLHDDADPDGNGPKEAADRLNAIQAQILAADPDVLCVQEDNWVTTLDSFLTNNGYTALRGKEISRAGWTGVTYESYSYQTIYYKTGMFDVGEKGQKWLSDTPDVQYSDSYGNGDTRPRGINYAELTNMATGETFYVFNVHLENGNSETRKNQANKLNDLVSQIAGETPYVICGDFNLSSNPNDGDDNDKATLSTLYGAYDNTRLVADLTETHATFINNSNEGKHFGVADATVTPTSGIIIDYCFTSKNDFNVYSYDVIAEKQDGIYTSDHLPLVIKVSIK